MLFRILLIISILYFYTINLSFSFEVKIKAEVNNEIITNIAVENEKKYLIFLNPKLKELKSKDIQNIAKNSI